MIQIECEWDAVKVDGHAGYAPIGQDIVCAAVSTLTETLIGALEELTENRISVEEGPGFSHIRFKDDPDHDAVILLDAFQIGAEAIAGLYPEYVQVKKDD